MDRYLIPNLPLSVTSNDALSPSALLCRSRASTGSSAHGDDPPSPLPRPFLLFLARKKGKGVYIGLRDWILLERREGEGGRVHKPLYPLTPHGWREDVLRESWRVMYYLFHFKQSFHFISSLWFVVDRRTLSSDQLSFLIAITWISGADRTAV